MELPRETPFRSVSPIIIVATGVLCWIGAVLGVIGAVWLLGESSIRWWWLLGAVLLVVIAIALPFAWVRAHLADRRLGETPAPDATVLVRVRPIIRGTFIYDLLFAAGCIAAAVWFVVDPSALADDRGGRHGASTTITIPADEFPADPTTMTPAEINDVIDRARTRAAEQARPPAQLSGASLVVAGFLLILADSGVLGSIWLLTNRRRNFLWISPAGIGYRPVREGDDGYLDWGEVSAVAHAALTVRGVVTRHSWTIEPVVGQPIRLQLLPGITPKPKVVFATIAEVAPDVELYFSGAK